MVHPRSAARARATRPAMEPLAVVQRLDAITSVDQAWQWLAGLIRAELDATSDALGLAGGGNDDAVIGRIVGAREQRIRQLGGHMTPDTVGNDADRVRALAARRERAARIIGVGRVGAPGRATTTETSLDDLARRFRALLGAAGEHLTALRSATGAHITSAQNADGTTPEVTAAVDHLEQCCRKLGDTGDDFTAAIGAVAAALDAAVTTLGDPSAAVGAQGRAEDFPPAG